MVGMDTSSIAAAATAFARQQTDQAVQLAVLKKANELQSQGAIQLVTAAVASYNNPPHLGGNIDTRA